MTDSNHEAEQLISKLLKGKEVFKLFSQKLHEHMTISGQTMEHWRDRFKLHIPTDNLTPQLCKEFDMEIMWRHQEASFYYAMAEAKAQFLKYGGETAYYERFHAIVEQHKANGGKVPAAATLQVLAKTDNQDVDAAATLAEIETKFWKNILDNLSTCRKLIENASLNISVEIKAETHQNYIDRMNTDRNTRS